MRPKILVPFDYSAAAEQALAWAGELRKATGGEPIQMVHAFNCGPAGAEGIPLQMLVPTEDEIRELEEKMLESARSHDVPAVARVVVRPSAPGDIILDEARHVGAELIVMGTHGRTGVRRLVLGSVAEHVLRHADCPVVTVHGPRGGLQL